MNLDELVASGTLPWQPSPEAHDVDVWHRYDIPLAGTYQLGDRRVLFTVVGDTSQNLSVWAYAPLTATDEVRADNAEFASTDEMRRFIEDMFANREAVFALARHLRVWKWTRRDVMPDAGLTPAATEALAAIVKSIVTERHQPPRPDVLFKAELAQAEITTREPVDA